MVWCVHSGEYLPGSKAVILVSCGLPTPVMLLSCRLWLANTCDTRGLWLSIRHELWVACLLATLSKVLIMAHAYAPLVVRTPSRPPRVCPLTTAFFPIHTACCCCSQNGRIKGEAKKALRAVIEQYGIPVTLSANQNILLRDIEPAWQQDIQDRLEVRVGGGVATDIAQTRSGYHWLDVMLVCEKL